MRHRKTSVSALLFVLASACGGEEADTAPPSDVESPTLGEAVEVPPGAEAVSFLGETMLAPDFPEATLEVYRARYQEAEDALANTPENVDSLIWMGRRTAYLGQYREAIEIYTHAISLHPEDARLYRHRGHRYISVRELNNAIADFERAAELFAGQPDVVEPDGLPNARGIPTSSLQYNTWYHLALAHYLKGDFEEALEAQRACMEVSTNPDAVVATSYWLYMTLARLGRTAEANEVLARISADMDLIENDSYLDLLLLFKGERSVEDLIGPAGGDATLGSTTTGYGVGVYHLLNGNDEEAYAMWERVRTGMNQWAAFGFIAAEAELARAGRGAQ